LHIAQQLNGYELVEARLDRLIDGGGHVGEISEELSALAIDAAHPAQCGLTIGERLRLVVTELERDLPREVQQVERFDDGVKVGG
jgi:hypothetical protein